MTGAPISGIRDCHPRHSTDYNTLATYDVHSKQGGADFPLVERGAPFDGNSWEHHFTTIL